jgi:hypothetical protein
MSNVKKIVRNVICYNRYNQLAASASTPDLAYADYVNQHNEPDEFDELDFYDVGTKLSVEMKIVETNTVQEIYLCLSRTPALCMSKLPKDTATDSLSISGPMTTTLLS